MKTARATLDALEPRQHLSRSQVVGYLTNYSYGSTIDVNKIDWSALTQVDYFAVIPSSAGAMTMSAADQTQLDAVVAKAHAHGVSVSIVLGGAGQDGTLLDIMGTAPGGNAAGRNALAASLNTFATAHDIDGVDLDWEPLTPTKTQVTNYGLLIKAVQEQTNLRVSAAVNPEKLPVSGGAAQGEYVLDATAIQYIDQIGVMAYDLDYAFHAEWTRSTNDLTAWSNYLTAAGQSKEKLLFGLPFYGRAGTSWGNTRTQSYRDLVNKQIATAGAAPAAAADNLNLAFADSFGGGATQWYFNGKQTINAKTGFALDSQVGGVMIWDLAQDHTDSSLNYTAQSLLPGIRTTVNARSTFAAASAAIAVDAGRQRVSAHFHTEVDADSVGPADLVLTNTTTGQTINTAGLATATVAEASGHGDDVVWSFNTSLLPDGNYTATVRAGAIRAETTGNALSTDMTATGFVLAGDANHDRAVNFADLVVLAQNYNGTARTFSQGDFDYDSDVDFQDLVILAQHYNTTLPALGTIAAVFSNRRVEAIAATTKATAPTKAGGRIAGDVLA